MESENLAKWNGERREEKIPRDELPCSVHHMLH